ncbi:MAG: carboxypeptidase regulatory-like domain-containing protein [Planctomycetes bacterium]|uniref:carboxypeptidase-like regulatory domain-containing protein n=1 Tax=Candidatus Wunengus sp. YC65 TaxID=3367701 RepID=UPI001DF4CE92|nr:carboxypeptidase regulatory-like domain-containing protein [Planctomycetota bacterium]
MIKFAAIVFCAFVCFCVAVNGDTVVLRNVGKDIDLKVVGVTGEYINAVISKKSIKSLNMQFLNPGNYPDMISLDIANVTVECKIKEITEDTIHVLIPTSKISSLQMSFRSDDKQTVSAPAEIDSKPKTTDVAEEKGKSSQIIEERELEPKIQEDAGNRIIVDEIRTDPIEKKEAGKYYRLKTKKAKKESLLEEDDKLVTKTEDVSMGIHESIEDEKPLTESGETSESNQDLLKESHDKEEVDKAVEEDIKKEEPVIQDRNLGSVEGKILRSGSPLSGCQVKLQMLEKSGLLAKGYRQVAEAVEIETVTDNEGVYRFANVSPGLYKLYWKPPSETSWVRRFKMEPDVIIEPGKLTNPKDIETLKRTLN